MVDIRKFVFVCICVFVFASSSAQNHYKLVEDKSIVQISGTSSLHDWEMVVKQFQCLVVASAQNDVLVIESIDFRCNAKSIESESSIMDGKAHKALKADAWESISFVLDKTQKINIEDGVVLGSVKGDASVAGTEHTVVIDYEGVVDEFNVIKLKGGGTLNMSDFGIKAPTALMGTIVTGDQVTVDLDLVFEIKQ